MRGFEILWTCQTSRQDHDVVFIHGAYTVMDPSGSISTSALDAANEALASVRLSSELTNGHSLARDDDTSSDTTKSPVLKATSVSHGRNTSSSSSKPSEQVSILRGELERVRSEKDTLDEHYRTLLEKVTAMRTTLGNKLKQDAVRIDAPLKVSGIS